MLELQGFLLMTSHLFFLFVLFLFFYRMVIDTNTSDVSPIMPPNNAMSSMSDIPVSPTSVASSGHFPFSASEMSGLGVDASALDTAFTSDVASSVGLQLPLDNGVGNSRDSLRSLAPIPWNFSFTDLTADLSNLGGNLIFFFF